MGKQVQKCYEDELNDRGWKRLQEAKRLAKERVELAERRAILGG